MIYKFTGVKDIIKQVSMNNYVVIIIYIWKKLYSLNTKWRQFSKHICIKRINIRAKLSVSV